MFAFWLTVKLPNKLNCQNGLCSQGIHVRYVLLNEHVQTFEHWNTLRNTYCKTGLDELT